MAYCWYESIFEVILIHLFLSFVFCFSAIRHSCLALVKIFSWSFILFLSFLVVVIFGLTLLIFKKFLFPFFFQLILLIVKHFYLIFLGTIMLTTLFHFSTDYTEELTVNRYCHYYYYYYFTFISYDKSTNPYHKNKLNLFSLILDMVRNTLTINVEFGGVFLRFYAR